MLAMVNYYALLNSMRYYVIRQKAAELGLDKVSDEEKAKMEASAKENWEQAIASYTQNVTEESSDDDKAAAILGEKEVRFSCDMKMGSAEATAWGCDLTYDYVKINGDYRS